MKEFEYQFAEPDENLTLSWTSKILRLARVHSQTYVEELRLGNLTDQKLEIRIEKHGFLRHPKRVVLKPKEVKHVRLKISGKALEKTHRSKLVLQSKNQKESIPVHLTPAR